MITFALAVALVASPASMPGSLKDPPEPPVQLAERLDLPGVITSLDRIVDAVTLVRDLVKRGADLKARTEGTGQACNPGQAEARGEEAEVAAELDVYA